MDIEHLVFQNGPKRVGPFSHAVRAGDFLFVTGQMPTLPENPDILISDLIHYICISEIIKKYNANIIIK